ncbi:hypothetical protein ACZ11_10620 [Lysinibacillus xylanilyticus]|uniref:Uncharacterized protein n=1 Tax=Lysinibacillus xylanilyticus TaxID=582475 RepID=A0A0K9FDG4_9BACI|nr:hypothetical protein [Lysinibacillus xylanilyticus]KMY32559.1 hypothetical protein ACZ11_10620 [Lysinibacillus xylanilyticus]
MLNITAPLIQSEAFTATGTTGNVIQKFEADNGGLKEILKQEMAKALVTAILERPALPIAY